MAPALLSNRIRKAMLLPEVSARIMRFWLGTHMAQWLWNGQANVPLFVSDRRLRSYKTLKPSLTEWCLDSGAFSELSMYGEYRTTPQEYATRIKRYQDEIGRLTWAAPQDWMCEPFMLERTGLTVQDHQTRTIDNYLELSALTGGVVIPVIQGYTADDYLVHVEQYMVRGIDLMHEPIVGVGSVCRRQHTEDIHEVFSRLYPLRMHGFGVKISGLELYAHRLESSDSMAWSIDARRLGYPACPDGAHINCANCPWYAQRWREQVVLAAQLSR